MPGVFARGDGALGDVSARSFWCSVNTRSARRRGAPTVALVLALGSQEHRASVANMLASQEQPPKRARIGALLALSCRNKATRYHIDASSQYTAAKHRTKHEQRHSTASACSTALQPRAAEAQQ